MKRFFLLLFCIVFIKYSTDAQSKVIKEGSDGTPSQIKTIIQNDTLAGYLAFTELGEIGDNKFGYKVSIMDKNLHDIGTLSFKDQKLYLLGVSFEQGIVCIAYFRSNVVGNSFTYIGDYQQTIADVQNSVFTQFFKFDGKLIKTNTTPVAVRVSPNKVAGSIMGRGGLRHGLSLNNVAGKGFVCFIGDEAENNLIAFDTLGNVVWQKQIDNADMFSVLTAKNDIYVLSKHKTATKAIGVYDLQAYNFDDTAVHEKYILKDEQGNSLTVLSSGTDPVKHELYLSGYIVNESRKHSYGKAKDVWRGLYMGVYTLNIHGHTHKDIAPLYSYWSDGSQSNTLSAQGQFSATNSYGYYYQSIKDDKGNTYFVGTKLIRKIKWPAIGCAAFLAPLVIPSIIIVSAGITSAKATDAIVLKQNAAGALSFEDSVIYNENRFQSSKFPVADNRSFSTITNATGTLNYLVIKDPKNITVYGIEQKKVVHTITDIDKSTNVNIYPGKEGFIMVSTCNKDEQYTKLTIEKL